MEIDDKKYKSDGVFVANGTRLRFSIASVPLYSKTTADFCVNCFGNVYNLEEIEQFDFNDFKREAFISLLNRLAGYFCIVYQNKKSNVVTFANDTFGNFRLYLYDDHHQIHLSDNWRTIVEQIKQDHGELESLPEERYYFSRHRYTTGGHTFIRHLDKLMPASICTTEGDRLTKEIYLPSKVEKTVNDSEYMTRNHNLIARNLRQGINPDNRNILFFSGGVDSTYLACTMMSLGLEFTPLFIKYDPPNGDNVMDVLKAETIARHLGLKLETIEVSIGSNIALIEQMVKRNPFDKALLIPMELAHETLSHRFGPCNVINGQASDSIYCWGATCKTYGSLIQRYLTTDYFTNRSNIIRAVIAKVVELVYRTRWKTNLSFRVPHENADYWLGLLDPEGYVPIIHTGAEHREYDAYLRRIVADIAENLRGNHAAIRMYMKLMFLQGPIDLCLVEIAHTYGHQLVLPYLDAGIIGLKLKYQDEWRDLFHPRYVLEQSLSERFDFDVTLIDRCRQIQTETEATKQFAILQKEIYQRWDQVSADLL